MARGFFLASIFIVTLINSSRGASGRELRSKTCGIDNENWSSCGTACPATCEVPDPGPCIMMCIRECQCKKGYYRRADGECVQQEDC